MRLTADRLSLVFDASLRGNELIEIPDGALLAVMVTGGGLELRFRTPHGEGSLVLHALSGLMCGATDRLGMEASPCSISSGGATKAWGSSLGAVDPDPSVDVVIGMILAGYSLGRGAHARGLCHVA